MSEPKEYLEGWTEFLGCRIDLSHRPLIPRPETEFWVENLISRMDIRCPFQVLDLFAGSGCVGIAIAKRFPNIHITFADKNNLMLEQIKINCDLNSLPVTSYELRLTDNFSNVPEKFDFILANPPYVAEGTGIGPASDGLNIMDHEPSEALYAGKDGLDVIRSFLEQAPEHLNKHRQIWMEFSSEQKDEIQKIISGLCYSKFEFYKDQYGCWRWVVVSS